MIMGERLILLGETMMILMSTSGVIFETFLLHKFFFISLWLTLIPFFLMKILFIYL